MTTLPILKSCECLYLSWRCAQKGQLPHAFSGVTPSVPAVDVSEATRMLGLPSVCSVPGAQGR